MIMKKKIKLNYFDYNRQHKNDFTAKVKNFVSEQQTMTYVITDLRNRLIK